MPDDQTTAGFQAPLAFRVKQTLRRIRRQIVRPRVVKSTQLLVVDESDRCTNPIFIIGMHRSGTTLIRQIIDSHSHIACPPETFFLIALAPLLDEEERFHRGLETMGFDGEGVARGLNRAIGYFYEAYRRSKDKPRWADKTPEYVRILPFIEQVFGPDCQYLMIYRHPLDVINSLMSQSWDFTMKQWQSVDYHEERFTNLLMYHADILQRQMDFAAAHADRCHTLRYEDVVADPETHLRRAFEFLGEPWEPEVLAYHKAEHDWGTGDPDANTSSGFRPSVGNWKRWEPEQIRKAGEILRAQCERLEYSLDG